MSRGTILVTGAREWTDVDTIRAWLRPLAPRPQTQDWFYRLVHGGARGADTLAGDVARELGFVVESYPVDESLDGPWPAAGVRRNQRMVDAEHARVRRVIAFTWWKGNDIATTGTSDCLFRCSKVGLPILIVSPGNRP